jgi:hypothetical protein
MLEFSHSRTTARAFTNQVFGHLWIGVELSWFKHIYYPWYHSTRISLMDSRFVNNSVHMEMLFWMHIWRGQTHRWNRPSRTQRTPHLRTPVKRDSTIPFPGPQEGGFHIQLPPQKKTWGAEPVDDTNAACKIAGLAQIKQITFSCKFLQILPGSEIKQREIVLFQLICMNTLDSFSGGRTISAPTTLLGKQACLHQSP